MARREELGFGLHPMFESAAHGPSLLFPDSISAPLDLFMHLFGFRFSDAFHHKMVVEKLFPGGPGLNTMNPGPFATVKLRRPEDWRSSDSSSTPLRDAHVGTALDGPRTVPVRSAWPGARGPSFSSPPQQADMLRTGTVRGPGHFRDAPGCVTRVGLRCPRSKNCFILPRLAKQVHGR